MKIIIPFMIVFSFLAPDSHSRQAKPNPASPVIVQDRQGNVYRLYSGRYALVIGISDYTGGWPKLPNAVQDAQAVGDLFSSLGFEVTRLMNPGESQLTQGLKDFIFGSGQNPDNCVVVFFAGHGHTEKMSYGADMGYIVPRDSPLPEKDKAGFMQKAIDMQTIDVYARRIQAKHALFLFDSCFSGAIFDMVRAIPAAIGNKTANPVRQFITAGGADESVPDRSIFKEQLIEGLRGEADLNGDGYVTGTELGEFLQEKIVNYSRDGQHPQYGKIRDPKLDKGDFVFVLVNGLVIQQGNILNVSADSAAETEFWKSCQKYDKKELYEDYMKKYPNGRFVILAIAAIKSLEERNKDNPGPILSREISVFQAKAGLISGYSKIMHRLITEISLENTEVSGQINLALRISESGIILITAYRDGGLKVAPPENRGLIRERIDQLLSSVSLEPPKDEAGNPASIRIWNVGFSCSIVRGRLVLNKIS